MSTHRQNAILLVVLLFAQLLLMSGSADGVGGAEAAESRFMRVTGPVIRVADTIAAAFSGALQGAGELIRARRVNTELEHELRELRAEADRRREAALQNQRLRRLLEMRDNLVPQSIGADVVTSALTGPSRTIVINRGSDSGVRRDLPVVAWGGVVGRVVAVGGAHARVQLLTDPNSGAAGVVQRSRAKGVVVGLGGGRLSMRYVPGFSDVIHGDRVVTSGLDGIFPRGLGIGTVVLTQENPDGSRTIELVPEVDYESLEEVLVLLEPAATELLDASAGSPEENEAP